MLLSIPIGHGPLPNLYVDLAFFQELKAPYKYEFVQETHSISEILLVFAMGGQLGILLAVHQSPPCGISTVHPCLWHSTPMFGAQYSPLWHSTPMFCRRCFGRNHPLPLALHGSLHQVTNCLLTAFTQHSILL